MQKVRGPGGGTYISKLEAQRPAPGPEVPAHRRAAPVDRDGVDAAKLEPAERERGRVVLEAAHVPDKIATAHAASFEGALAELGRIAELAGGLGGFREKQVSRTLEQLYKVLAGVLGRSPAGARPEITRRTLTAMAELMERVGPNELLAPVMTAAVGLVDSGSRLEQKGRLDLVPETAMEVARDVVLELHDALLGRRAAAAAINTLAPLVERLELSYPRLTSEERARITAQTAEFLATTGPRDGFDLAMVARFSELVGQAAQERPAAAMDALALAAERFRADHAGLFEQARAGLGAEAAGASPGRIALEKALLTVLEASPAGSPSLFEAADKLRAVAARPDAPPAPAPPPPRPVRPGYPRPVVRPVARPAPPPLGPVLAATAPLLAKAATSPVAAGLISFITERAAPLSQQPLSVQALERAGKAETLALACRHLIEAEHAARTRQAALPPDLVNALPALEALGDTAAMQVTLAFLGALRGGTGDLANLTALIERARSTRPDDPLQTLQGLALRFGQISTLTTAFRALAPEKADIVAALVAATQGAEVDAAALKQVLTVAQQLKASFPLAPVAPLFAPAEDGRTSLLELIEPRAHFGSKPADLLAQLLQQTKGAGANDRNLQAALAETALAISLEGAKIVGGATVHHKRIVADWRAAVVNPAALRTSSQPQSGVAVRAGAQPSIGGFLAAHPALSRDFALTAGLHLTPDQLAFVIDRVSTARGRDTARAIRDFVFACVDAKQLDLIEAVRTSQSPPKAISAVITEVAQSYRNAGLAAVPFAAMIEGLRAGADPQAAIVEERTRQALAGLQLQELGGGKLDPKGLADVTSIAKNIAELLAQFQPGFRSTLDKDIDMGAMRPVFLACLRSVLDGTWPAPKYENEVGRRIMGKLTPAQQEVWRQELVTGLVQAEAPKPPETMLAAKSLARGLIKAIPMEARLLPAELRLTFDAPSAERARALRDEKLAALHDTEKGSPAHRKLGKELAELSASVAAIELVLALEQHLGGAKGAAADPKAALTLLAPALPGADRALKRLGASGSAQAAAELAVISADLGRGPPARKGKYAADEDGLVPLIDSHKTGCLSFGDKRRRWGLAGALADPNIRMLRVYDGDKQRYRTFLKFFEIEVPGYKGPALWLDTPRPDGGGDASDLALLYKHAFEKARLMGVPLFSSQLQQLPEGWKQEQANVKLFIDDGNTGFMHSDSMFGGKGAIRTSRGAKPVWELAKAFQLARPPA